MPTYGLVSRHGVIPNSFTFDHCGPMARTAEDCAILLQAIAGYDPRDAGSTRQPIADYRGALAQFGIRGLKNLKIGVLRHYWEEDLVAHDDLRAAMEEAIRVFTGLGATLEDCRSRPMQDGLDVKVLIAETEMFAIQQKDLMARPGDYGRDFLGRVLPACLFHASDYVQALREHRRLMADMQPLLGEYDVLLTAGFGPAPRFEDCRTANFWKRSNVFTPSNAARTPSLVVCGGFSAGGLPLGVQLITRPFNDAQLLAAGHAYQQVTDWHRRTPPLDPAAQAPAVDTQVFEPRPAADADAAMRALVETMACSAGLKLNDRQMEILLENAPEALAMAERIRRPRDRMDQPSSTFRFSGS
jgi:aspartyl-tRNA(Asn)/glutamyl-tRNA(Gln) amidotransferase subunit A